MSEPFNPTLTPKARDELIAELCDENNKLRAELAAERDAYKYLDEKNTRLHAERDALRELLGEAADVLEAYAPVLGKAMIARIDTALNKGGGGET